MTAPVLPATPANPLRRVTAWRVGRWAAVTVLAVAATAVAVVAIQRVTLDRLLHDTTQADSRTLEVYAAGIDGTLDRYPRSIVLLAQDPRLTAAFGGDPDRVATATRLLDQYVAMSGAVSAFILDTDADLTAASTGIGRADQASVWFAEQPAFGAALTGRLGRAFGPVPTRGDRQYFYARRMRDDTGTLGVLVVAVAINELELLWRIAEREVLVVDGDGVVVLSSEPAWRLRQTAAGSPRSLDFALPAAHRCDQRFTVAGAGRICQAQRILHLDWNVYLLSPTAPLERRAWIFALEVVLALVAALLIAGFAFQRITLKDRLNRDLHRRVEQRTAQIQQTNTQLRSEIASRIAKEQELHQAQDDLVQAGKLAALGQMAAGLVHELNQPLAALRTYNDNTSAFLARDDARSAATNVRLMDELIERMSRISAQLKSFARRTPLRLEPVDLGPAIDAAVRLVSDAARGPMPAVTVEPATAPLLVTGEPVRLQQVLVNLLRNALDATGAAGAVNVAVKDADDAIAVHIADDGPGIAGEDLPNIFDPFFTTKGGDRGMGLGLSVSRRIAEDFGGSLTAENLDAGGCRFTFVLRPWREAS